MAESRNKVELELIGIRESFALSGELDPLHQVEMGSSVADAACSGAWVG